MCIWEGVVILKELTFINFHLGCVVVFQNVFCNRFNFGVGRGGVERTNFEQFLLLREGVVMLKEVIFNSFNFGEGLVVLKELIFNSFYLGWVW